MNKAVFLDRDGVINRATVMNGKPYSPVGLNNLEILNGVKESITAMQNANWIVIVVTNQPDVARNKISKDDVEKINDYLKSTLLFNEIYTCYHDNNDFCDCRKPKPGMLLTASKKNNISLKNSYMIGDRWTDIEAGNRAGCTTIFVDYNYKEKRPFNYKYKVKSLKEATDIILKNE